MSVAGVHPNNYAGVLRTLLRYRTGRSDFKQTGGSLNPSVACSHRVLTSAFGDIGFKCQRPKKGVAGDRKSGISVHFRCALGIADRTRPRHAQHCAVLRPAPLEVSHQRCQGLPPCRLHDLPIAHPESTQSCASDAHGVSRDSSGISEACPARDPFVRARDMARTQRPRVDPTIRRNPSKRWPLGDSRSFQPRF